AKRDWSSDVCSSDLGIPATGQLGRYSAARGRMGVPSAPGTLGGGTWRREEGRRRYTTNQLVLQAEPTRPPRAPGGAARRVAGVSGLLCARRCHTARYSAGAARLADPDGARSMVSRPAYQRPGNAGRSADGAASNGSRRGKESSPRTGNVPAQWHREPRTPRPDESVALRRGPGAP